MHIERNPKQFHPDLHRDDKDATAKFAKSIRGV